MKKKVRTKSVEAVAPAPSLVPEIERLERQLREEKASSEQRERQLLLALVSVLDGFLRLEKATTAEPLPQEARRVHDRFILIRRKLEAALERESVMRVNSHGMTVNPQIHQVVEMRSVENTAGGTIVEVEEHAFLFRGNVLRQGKVVVAE